jgi:anti-sigma factor RsiW
MLEEYFEGTLPPSKATRVADHLLVCARCAAELRRIERIVGALAAVPAASAPDYLLHAITARAAELPLPAARRPVSGWRWVGLLAGASMAAFALIAYLLPLLIAAGLQSQWVSDAVLFARASARAGYDVLVASWSELATFAHGLGLAGKTVAPTLGLYAAAEIGIIVGLVFVLHAARRRRLAAHHLLVF